ncbi:MAG TPA: purine-nucleoside phosphorylase [Lacibacter sp.]|nr:purine-nucleoside phosphorylase [Lacibacter sp.]HMO90327.1 purine-nucleoside phosphorylase [Lacibacter sp.]HMP88306.1 purine-nucleoside phosphorylase [Lacibacter sp.]
MSLHISAPEGSIASTVLLPGDPLRARYIAENFLTGVQLVSQTRNVFFFTGSYNNQRITIGASGMGCPSIGIYSYELYMSYQVETIIRIGTCGAYTTDLQLYDLVNARQAASESTFARFAWGITDEVLDHQGPAFSVIGDTAAQRNTQLRTGAIHSSDIFYRNNTDLPAVAARHQCLAVEMEAFALFANARYLGKGAATLLTVSDILPTGEYISAGEREQALLPMMELALEAAIRL